MKNKVNNWLDIGYTWVWDNPIPGLMSLFFIAFLIGAASRALTLSFNFLNPPLASFENWLHTSCHMTYSMIYLTLFLTFRVLTLPLRLMHSKIDRKTGRIMKCSGSIGNIVAAIAILILPFTEMNLLLLIVQTDYKYPGAPSTIEWSKIIGSICTIPFFLIQLAATFAVFYAIFHIFGSRLRRPNNMQVFDLASFKKRYWDDTVMRIDKSESNLQSFIKRYWVERDEILIIRQIPAEILIYFPNMLMSGWICADERLLAIMLAFILAKIVIDAISYFISCWLDWINYLWLRKICMDAAASAGVSYKPNALQLLEGLFKTDAYLFECFMIEFMPDIITTNDPGLRKMMKRAFANSAFANSHIINTCSFSLTIAGRICEEFGYNPQTGDFKKYASVLDSLVKIAIYFDCDFAKYFNLWLIHEKFKNPYLSAWLNMNEEEIT